MSNCIFEEPTGHSCTGREFRDYCNMHTSPLAIASRSPVSHVFEHKLPTAKVFVVKHPQSG